MTAEDPIERVKTATARYNGLKDQLDAAQRDVLDACADAARAGYPADELAQYAPFGPTYIRKQVRERGVEARKGGPKPRRKDAR